MSISYISISCNFIITNDVNRKITSYIYLVIYKINITSCKTFYCTNEKGKYEKIFFCNYRSYPCKHIDQWPRKTRESTTALKTKTKPRVRIKRLKSVSYLVTYGQSCKTWNYTPQKNKINSYVLWKCIMGWKY
jgi:hypothetical protein